MQVVFSKLEKLELEKLNVGKIWNGGQLRSSEFGFQSLTRLTVRNCDGLKGLIPSSAARSLVHLKYLYVSCCVAMEEVVFIEESTPEATSTFENSAIFQKLETLHLCELPNLKRFYAGDYVDYPSLSWLEIYECPKLQEFLTNSMPVRDNGNTEDLLDQVNKQLLFNHKVVFSKLEELSLSWLNVGKIWNGDLPRSSEFGFQSLTVLAVSNCHGLKGLIPSSAARSLVHLKDLSVSCCVAMEEVVFIEESTQEATSTFENIAIFPKLRFLYLVELPNLKRFYAGDYVDCSSLRSLHIEDCPKLGEIFLTDSIPTIKDKNIEDLSDQVDKQPLLIHKDPVKTDQLITTESGFFSKITCEPRQLGGAVEEHHHDMVFKINRFVQVTLGGLPNLEHPYKVLQYVDELVITECDGLKVLAPPLLSLQTLTILKITSCKGLTSTLFHRSTAKSLLQLRDLIIYGCPNLRQVIANDYNKEAHDDDLDEIGDDIILSKLKDLRLKDLSSLEIFYSGDSVLKFPRLIDLEVDGCLCMKTFSHGNIDCPMLDNTSWEGDINTTIQKRWMIHHSEELL